MGSERPEVTFEVPKGTPRSGTKRFPSRATAARVNSLPDSNQHRTTDRQCEKTRDDDMPHPEEIPTGLAHVRSTQIFDEHSVPRGLLAAHRIAPGVWGRLVVNTGCVRFQFEDEGSEPRAISAGESVVIPPERPHRVLLDRPATFSVEFYRRPS